MEQKIFPDLMSGKTILYVHGFGSAGSTHTAELLRQLMPRATVIAPDLPIHPDEAISLLNDTVATARPQLIVGTSMGGMYAEQLHGVDRILVNPAFEMGDTMSHHGMVGKQTFQNPRQDGVQEFIVTKALVKEYRDCTTHCFADVTDEERQRVYGLFGGNDELVDTFGLFSAHYPQAIPFHGGHRLTESVILHSLIPVIRWIDDRQEGRERQQVYIHESAMKDAHGNPASCLLKTFEYLIETYDVGIVAPAAVNSPDVMAATAEWVMQVLSTPAWNRLTLTNQPERLLGDFIIAGHDMAQALKHSAFMGTVIEWGSDTFKTWEEILVFFQRLRPE